MNYDCKINQWLMSVFAVTCRTSIDKNMLYRSTACTSIVCSTFSAEYRAHTCR